MTVLPTLKETVEKYGLLAKKSLGQNFLLDTNITEKIIRLSLQARKKENFSDEHVYEVGPGPGGLTRAVLANNPQKFTVIELDERCIQIMQEIKDIIGDSFEIVEGDAMRYDFNTDSTEKKSIVSNLPYNISVPLLLGWLNNMDNFESLTLMFQKEVAERISAEQNSKSYGRLSVISQLCANITHLFDLSPTCFVPAPKIWSSVLLFTKNDNIPEKALLDKVSKITEAAFGQRRKMIRQSLKQFAELEEACTKADIKLTDRAENITPQQYLELAKLL